MFLPKSVKCSRLSVTIIFLIKSKSLTNIEGYVPAQKTPYLQQTNKLSNKTNYFRRRLSYDQPETDLIPKKMKIKSTRQTLTSRTNGRRL